ncbi:ABC transporter ATP-binding protein [Spongiactinospora sp. TRM90649]|uniref:ABC transporter ATP-binding protein n=1 Tax=Spongiactinospora sp. TRM90649 TaxID=3031114 RepID=UPI0023F84247|nr:ABC transporter ATP-binding protein [Spongiactinospora sp. TRM90649]MDF5759274.1 ABC transporter ATP-binding protein [Spongiactinospora sp. TRM90649]
MTETLARAIGVSRRYGDLTAVDDVSLDIPAGQLLGLLGPNGAGKSTLMNMFVGLRRPSAGRIELFGYDPRDAKARQRMGMTPQDTGLPETLRVGEVIDFVAAHFANPADKNELLAQFQLDALARRQTGALSGGEKRRLAIALAFVGRPDLVFLDEPTTGLDVEARRTLWDGVRAYNQAGGAVVLTSHYLEEVEALAQRVVIMQNGTAVADDSVDALRNVGGMRRVSMIVPEVPALPGVVGVERDGDRVELITQDSDALVRGLIDSGVAFRDLEVRAGTLEDAFLAITAKAPTTAAVS